MCEEDLRQNSDKVKRGVTNDARVTLLETMTQQENKKANQIEVTKVVNKLLSSLEAVLCRKRRIIN
jgi:hypothetical protein